jgi:hypothetical protein
MEAVSCQKHMIVNRLPLPRDIIDNEIKSYIFHDKISGEAKTKKQNLNQNFKMNILCTRSNFFGIDLTGQLHLRMMNCERCGNYLLFGSMFSFTQPQLGKITCQCTQSDPVEIMWDEDEEDMMQYHEEQESQGTLEEHYDDEDIIQDTEWDEEYSGK